MGRRRPTQPPPRVAPPPGPRQAPLAIKLGPLSPPPRCHYCKTQLAFGATKCGTCGAPTS